MTIDEIKKIDGEATANNRKAKLIFLFEWVIEGTFIARVSGSEDEYKGTFDIPNLSDENDASEVDVNSSLSGNGPMAHQIRQVLNKSFIAKIQDVMGIYIRELKEEFSKGLILPTDKVKPQVVTTGKTSVVDKRQFQNTVVAEKDASTSGNEVFSTKEVSTSDTYKATPDRVFEALTETQFVRGWTNNSIGEWNFKEGGSFALFGENVTGTFEKIEPNKEIVKKWRLKKYPNNHHATIHFQLKDTVSFRTNEDKPSIIINSRDLERISKSSLKMFQLISLKKLNKDSIVTTFQALVVLSDSASECEKMKNCKSPVFDVLRSSKPLSQFIYFISICVCVLNLVIIFS